MNDESYNLAQTLAGENRNEEALAAFQAAADFHSNSLRARFGAALMMQRLQRHAECVDVMSNLIEKHPDLADAHYTRALSLMDLGHHQEALDDLRTSLKLNSKNLDAMYAAALCLKSLEYYEEALELLDKLLKCNTDFVPAYSTRAKIHSVLSSLPSAIADFSASIQHGYDAYDVRLLRGLAYYRTGMLAEAYQDLTKAISIRPEEGSTYIRRWQVLKEMGDDQAAADDLVMGQSLLKKS